MNDLESLLPAALDDLGRDAPHDSDLAGKVSGGVRRRRWLTAAPLAAVLAVAVALGAIWVSRAATGTGSAPTATTPSACGPLDVGPLPTWARAGFTRPSGNPFALSEGGSMAAVIFADPLSSPPAPDSSNKILWVAREPELSTDDLVIVGRLEGSDATSTVDTGTAPGPSYVDMPQPGCWQLDLTWGTHTDRMHLRWQAG